MTTRTTSHLGGYDGYMIMRDDRIAPSTCTKQKHVTLIAPALFKSDMTSHVNTFMRHELYPPRDPHWTNQNPHSVNEYL